MCLLSLKFQAGSIRYRDHFKLQPRAYNNIVYVESSRENQGSSLKKTFSNSHKQQSLLSLQSPQTIPPSSFHPTALQPNVQQTFFSQSLPFLYDSTLKPFDTDLPRPKIEKRETQTIFKSRLFRTLGRQNIAAVTNRVGGVEGMTLWPKKLDSKAIFECRQKKYQQQSLQKKIKHQQA